MGPHGPDGIHAEILKSLDDDCQARIVQLYERWWTNASFPTDLTHVDVATSFKKGDTGNIDNYRPI